tara:strand:+ start:42 stop:617 length:576 start_codon:yes stop_codon:yes gene_type:complete
MKEKYDWKFILFVGIPPLLFLVCILITLTKVIGDFKEKRALAKDEAIYGPQELAVTIDSPSKSEAKELCIKRSKESLESQIEDYKKMNKMAMKGYGKAFDIRPSYSYIPSKFNKVENLKIICNLGEVSYGNKKLGIKKGEVCDFSGSYEYTVTHLIPDKYSVDNPKWNIPRETSFPIAFGSQATYLCNSDY